MLAGDLYIAGNILPENKSIHGKKIVQKINNTPIECQGPSKNVGFGSLKM